MRNIIVELALGAMCLALPANAQQRAGQQSYPGVRMPPDMVASPDSHPAPAPKPERNALPQSDQAAPAQQRPVTPAPAAVATPNVTKTARKGRKAKPSPVPTSEPVAQAPAPPPPPPTPQQMPPSPPQVQYRDGLLTVSAKNSSLSDVLNAIRAQTGANMTLPPGLNDRLFVQLGPAPPRDVISKLLSGTNFDYVLAGSPQNPQGVQQVIVTPRQGGAAVAQNAGGPPAQTRLPGMGTPANNEEEEEQPAPQTQPQQMPGGFGAPGGPGPFQPNPAMAPPNVANPTPYPQTPGPTGTAPVMPPNQPPQMPPQQPPQGNQMKTPEQLLQELKQMQQQQQQQQQQQKPPR